MTDQAFDAPPVLAWDEDGIDSSAGWTLAAVRRAWGLCAGETRDRRLGRHEEAPG